MIIHGILSIDWEHTNGILWCIDDNEKKYILKTGDHLKVFDGESEIWSDEIKFKIVNDVICGMFVTEIQNEVDPKQWFGMFYTGSKALLIRKEV